MNTPYRQTILMSSFRLPNRSSSVNYRSVLQRTKASRELNRATPPDTLSTARAVQTSVNPKATAILDAGNRMIKAATPVMAERVQKRRRMEIMGLAYVEVRFGSCHQPPSIHIRRNPCNLPSDGCRLQYIARTTRPETRPIVECFQMTGLPICSRQRATGSWLSPKGA